MIIGPARVGLGAWVGAAVLVVALAACDGDSSADPPVNETTAAPTETSAPPRPPTSSASPSDAPSDHSDQTFTIIAGGDVLLHEPTWTQADADAGTSGDGELDFGPQMQAIAPYVASADLALCHLETPLAPAGGPFSGYPSFSGPPQIATALAETGFDACSVASNHTWDQGLAGIERTVRTLSDAGVTPYGAAVGGLPGNPTVVDVAGIQIGLLSYTYGFNGTPADGSVETIDISDVLADAGAARAGGADLVVASLHWGTEYSHELNAQQRDLAPLLLASPDVDLLICHHAHVVQPIAKIDGEWVAYGLGNMLASHATVLPDNQEGVLARFTFGQSAGGWSVVEAAYLPIMVDPGPPLRMVDLPRALAGNLADGLSGRYDLAISRTREIVHRFPGSDELVEIAPG